jgi:hypothetical protein
MELYLHSPVRLNGMVLSQSTGTALLFTIQEFNVNSLNFHSVTTKLLYVPWFCQCDITVVFSTFCTLFSQIQTFSIVVHSHLV